LGHRTEAGGAFARAANLFPGAQSVRLAVAQLAMLGSDRDEALASVQAIKITDGASDPWWSYDTDLVWNVAGPLALLRANINERLK
jgi:predicted Zn-dependent protease